MALPASAKETRADCRRPTGVQAKSRAPPAVRAGAAGDGFLPRRWWEIDASWYILFVLEKMHVIWGVRRPRVDTRDAAVAVDLVMEPETASV